MRLEIRPPGDADWQAFAGVMQETFMERWPEAAAERMRASAEMARPLGGFDGDKVEATGGAYRHVMQVPGGRLPCTGITWITVSARHRRQGVLRELMRRLHERGAADGEPIAALFAAEGAIYNRFGYGMAGRSVHLRVPARKLKSLPVAPGRVVEVDKEEALKRFPPVFEIATAGRPGVCRRDERWWKDRILRDLPATGKWLGPRYLVYVDATGRDRGCAIAALKGGYGRFLPKGRCRLNELHAVDAEAAAALWRYAGDFDLVRTVEAGMRPPDEPLPLMVADVRSVRLNQDEELWVHLTDPPRALAGRRYAADGRLVLRVNDPAWPPGDGTFSLDVHGGAGQSERVDATPDLEMHAADLGSIYMGTVSPLQLAAAGRVRELREGALVEAHRLFNWAPAAWCPDQW